MLGPEDILFNSGQHLLILVGTGGSLGEKPRSQAFCVIIASPLVDS